jgi:hypothetical protein
MFSSDCSECDRLFDDFRNATMERFRLEGRRQVAAFSFDRTKESIIRVQVDLATLRCEELRAELAQHQSSAHPPSEAARSAEG